MNDLSLLALDGAAAVGGVVVRLSDASEGDAGVIIDVRAERSPDAHGVAVEELQRRLLEFGFVEGARIEVTRPIERKTRRLPGISTTRPTTVGLWFLR